MMSNIVALTSVIAGAAIPVSFISSVIKQDHWPKWCNQLIALATTGIAGAIAVGLSGGFSGLGSQTDPSQYIVTISAIYGASQAFYMAFRNSDMEKTLSGFPQNIIQQPTIEAVSGNIIQPALQSHVHAVIPNTVAIPYQPKFNPDDVIL